MMQKNGNLKIQKDNKADIIVAVTRINENRRRDFN
jgi:hypothetical protein